MALLWSYPLLLRGRTTNRTHTYPVNELNIDPTVFKIRHSLNLTYFYHNMTVVIIALSLMTQSGCHILTSLSTLLPFLAVNQKYNLSAMAGSIWGNVTGFISRMANCECHFNELTDHNKEFWKISCDKGIILEDDNLAHCNIHHSTATHVHILVEWWNSELLINLIIRNA